MYIKRKSKEFSYLQVYRPTRWEELNNWGQQKQWMLLIFINTNKHVTYIDVLWRKNIKNFDRITVFLYFKLSFEVADIYYQ